MSLGFLRYIKCLCSRYPILAFKTAQPAFLKTDVYPIGASEENGRFALIGSMLVFSVVYANV